MGWVLHAARRAEGGGDSREDGDYYVEYFTPESVVVEGSHFCLDYRLQITEYRVKAFRLQSTDC